MAINIPWYTMIYYGCLMTFWWVPQTPGSLGLLPLLSLRGMAFTWSFKLDVSLLAKLKPLVKFEIRHVQAVTTIPLDLSLPYRSLGTNGTRNGGRHSSVSFMPINWTTVTHSWILMKCRVRWHKLFLGFFPLLYSMTIASNMVVPLRTAATKHFLVVSTLFLSLKLSCSSV